MKHLHPLAWLGIGGSLSAVALQTQNWLVGLVVLFCVIGLSRVRGGSRVAAFAGAMKAGGILFATHLVLGALVSKMPDNPTVLFFLPEWVVSQGISIGGPYSVGQLSVSVERGLDAWVVCAIVGLMWQACPAGQWCDLAVTVFGRGGQLLVPGICLGESLARVQRRPRGRGVFMAVADANQQLSDLWRVNSRPSRPNPGHAAVAAVLFLMVGGVLFWISWLGGLRVRLAASRLVTISSPGVLAGVLVVWFIARLSVSHEELTPALRRADVGALIGFLLIVASLLFSRWTGDTTAMSTKPGTWPQVPLVIVGVMASMVVLWSVLDRSAGRVAS